MVRGRIFLFLFLALSLALPSAGWAKDALWLQPCTHLYADLFSTQNMPEGPRIRLLAERSGLRDFDSIDELRVGQFNLNNMYNYRGKWETDTQTGRLVLRDPPYPKPEIRWRQLKEVIKRSDDDIMVWEEVEDFTAAKDFVDSQLDGKYRVLLIDGNDERGIDIALLVKKDLPFDIEMQSHRNLSYEKNGQQLKVFSRDLPVVTIRKAGSPADSKPLVRIAGTHYKSMQDAKGDPGSTIKRTRQVKATADILSEYERKDPKSPILLIGDFNADVRTGPEMESLWEAGYKDSFDLSPTPLPADQRITHTYIPENEPPKHRQLDAILVSKAGQENIVKDARIVPFKNSDGTDMLLPQTLEERDQQGSDHRKLQLLLDFGKLRENWRKP